MPQTTYRFGPFTLDTAAYRLLKGSTEIALTPKAFELLRHLVERPGTLVSKEELFERVWPHVAVTDNALTQVVSDLRQALGDAAGSPGYVQTVARRGYRFIGAVERVAPAMDRSMAEGAADKTVRPSLVVLDFVNVNGDANLAWLSAGIAETVAGELGSRPQIRSSIGRVSSHRPRTAWRPLTPRVPWAPTCWSPAPFSTRRSVCASPRASSTSPPAMCAAMRKPTAP